MTFALYHLTSPRINRRHNIPLHFRALARAVRSAGPAGVQHQVLASRAALRNRLARGGCTVLYLLAHSEGRRGMAAGQGGWIDGRRLAQWLPGQPERLPRVMFFNTCDAVKSGLVEAALGAGVGTVVAADREIRIVGMCDYAETVFRQWADDVPLAEAVRRANEMFLARDVHFDIFGDQETGSLRSLLGGKKTQE